jgi:hypothetical protein
VIRRILEIATWSDVLALGGGSPSHSSSINRPAEMAWPCPATREALIFTVPRGGVWSGGEGREMMDRG